MKEVRVIIPEPNYSRIEFKQDGFWGTASVNSSLKEFEYKEVFGWHLSLMFELESCREDRMPNNEEKTLMVSYKKELDELFKIEEEKPNSLFLAQIFWNDTVELIWRVHDPELANNMLQGIIEAGTNPRSFDYRIDPDASWELCEWHLSNAR